MLPCFPLEQFPKVGRIQPYRFGYAIAGKAFLLKS